MTQQRLGTILLWTAAGLLVVTGGLHLSGFGQINAMAQASSAEVKSLLPLLWVCVGVDFVVTGIIVAAVGFENSNGGRYVLFAVAISPLVGAVLQIIFLGFIPPTAILLFDGAVVLAAAVLREPRRRRSS